LLDHPRFVLGELNPFDDVFMMDVPPPALRAIAREYWVRAVTPWEGR